MRALTIVAYLCAGVLVLNQASSFGQEPDQRQSKQPNPRANTREFLGLGPAPDAKAAQLGEPLYRENCATCHGQNARGAQGPSLVRSPLVLHDEKGEEIGPVVKKGRAQGGMPAFPGLSDTQIYDVAEYIHLQIELAANRGTYGQTYASVRNQVTGNSEKGKDLFQIRCAGCHSASGDLSKIGAKYPQAAVMLARFAWPVSSGPREVTIVSRQGMKVTGELISMDDFDVSLRDAQGEYRNWPRAEVKVQMTDPLAGHRALLPMYSDSDLHDLTAYLVSLK